MGSIFLEYFKHVMLISVCIPVQSWAQIDCKELGVPSCNYTLRLEQSGIHSSAVYEIEDFNDTCALRNIQDGVYRTITIQCLKNDFRITYHGKIITTERLVIKNCVIYWKDIKQLACDPRQNIKELILDNCNDEFDTNETDYFSQCLSGFYVNTNVAFFPHPTAVRLLSSVARSLSEVFYKGTWPNVKKMSIKG